MSICFIISFFLILRLPFGGAITIGKMLPLVFFTYFYGLKSGVLAGFVYSILQITIFFHVPPAQTPFAFIFAILLDYVIPYVFIGFTEFFKKNVFHNTKKYFVLSIIFSYSVRFLCGFLSGIIIWSEYIPTQYNICIYSLVYNLIYIVPETLIALIVCNILLNFFVTKNINHTL